MKKAYLSHVMALTWVSIMKSGNKRTSIFDNYPFSFVFALF